MGRIGDWEVMPVSLTGHSGVLDLDLLERPLIFYSLGIMSQKQNWLWLMIVCHSTIFFQRELDENMD